MQQKRRYGLDIIKILSTFMVCFYHLKIVNMGTFVEGQYIPSVGRLLTNFCAMSVPLFFMVNGAIMLRKSLTVKQVIWRFGKIVLLYAFWTNVIDIIADAVFRHTIDLSLNAFLTRGKYTAHLWYLLTLAILTLLIPLINWCYKKNKLYIYIPFVLLLIFPFLYNYAIIGGELGWIPFLAGKARTGLGTLYAFVYFVLGKVLTDIVEKKRESHTKKIAVISAVGCILGWILVTFEGVFWTSVEGSVFDGVNSSFPTIGALLMAAGVFVLIEGYAPCEGGKAIAFFANNMLGIYIFHYIFTEKLEEVIGFNAPVLVAVLLTALIIMITAVMAVICKKVPLLKNLLKI